MRVPRRLIGLALLASLSAAGPSVDAATELVPPATALRAPQNDVAVVEVLAVDEGRLRVSVLEMLRGSTEGELVVRIPPGLADLPVPGVRAILGFTSLRKDPRGRSRDYQPDPLGPRIVELPTVGPAVFEATGEIRSLVSGSDPADELRAALRQAARPHRSSRRFVLSELALRPELLAAAEEAEIAALRSLTGAEDLEPLATDYLLRALLPIADSGGDWIASLCRREIDRQGAQLDLASAVPAMLETAIGLLGQVGDPSDAPRLVRHLVSNNPAVGRAAFGALWGLDAAAARAAGARALGSGELRGDVRRLVEEALARN